LTAADAGTPPWTWPALLTSAVSSATGYLIWPA
jgi:hypothetical protein